MICGSAIKVIRVNNELHVHSKHPEAKYCLSGAFFVFSHFMAQPVSAQNFFVAFI